MGKHINIRDKWFQFKKKKLIPGILTPYTSFSSVMRLETIIYIYCGLIRSGYTFF